MNIKYQQNNVEQDQTGPFQLYDLVQCSQVEKSNSEICFLRNI